MKKGPTMVAKRKRVMVGLASALAVGGIGTGAVALVGVGSAVAAPTPAHVLQVSTTVPDLGPAVQQGDPTAPDTTGTATETTTPETTGEQPASATEAVGSGGHQDPAGQNADHQFDGVE